MSESPSLVGGCHSTVIEVKSCVTSVGAVIPEGTVIGTTLKL